MVCPFHQASGTLPETSPPAVTEMDDASLFLSMCTVQLTTALSPAFIVPRDNWGDGPTNVIPAGRDMLVKESEAGNIAVSNGFGHG